MTERADIVLFILASVLGLWGLSVFWRGVAGTRRRHQRCCRKCGGDPESTHTCRQCGFKPKHWKGLYARQRSAKVAAIGAMAITLGGLSAWGGFVVLAWLNPYGDPPGLSPYGAMSVGVLLFALTLIITGLLGERAKGRKRCPKCWYDMEGASGLQCPECGHEAAQVRALFRPRRRKGRIAAGLIVLLVGLAGFRIEPTIEHGWRGAIPTTVLIAGFEWLPESVILDNDPNGTFRPGSLEDRYWEDTIWGWQDAWLEARADRIVTNTNSSTKAAIRARPFSNDVMSDDLYTRILIKYCARIASSDKAIRDTAASEIYATGIGSGGRFLDISEECRHYETGLLRVLATAGGNDLALIYAADFLAEIRPIPAEAAEWAFTTRPTPNGNGPGVQIRDRASYHIMMQAVLDWPDVRRRLSELLRSEDAVDIRFAATSILLSESLRADADSIELLTGSFLEDFVALTRCADLDIARIGISGYLRLNPDESARAQFLMSLAESRPELAETAIDRLKGLTQGVNTNIPRLLVFLESEDPAVRRNVITLLMYTIEDLSYSQASLSNRAEVIDRLKRTREDDPNDSVRNAASLALNRYLHTSDD